ncbi:hypothetical protein RHSIM_Rhsim08G0116800 [Rhododendron simsii]|uniref:Reverse transcriptase n=1 Tax=Rhododendron simsii TaxID=118357 RepID=A0A834GHY7_RHOSS|nr:hypothetical protein RHSIM_Rhsim08G0116800 [Rhododendron simsii]
MTSSDKIKLCRKKLRRWRASQRMNSRVKMNELQAQLEQENVKGGFDPVEYRRVKECMRKASVEEEEYWKNKAKVSWLRLGDKNTAFFHAKTVQRRAANRINGLEDRGGTWKESDVKVEGIVFEYFHHIFTSSNPSGFDEVLGGLEKKVTEEMNARLLRLTNLEEVRFDKVLGGLQKKVTEEMNARLLRPTNLEEVRLSVLLQKVEVDRSINGIKICRNSPSVSHLFFADDTLLFGEASDHGILTIKRILEVHGKVSGQIINFGKSCCFFSVNTPVDKRDRLSQLLGIRKDSSLGNYLGLPTDLSQTRYKVFSYIKDRMRGRTEGWNEFIMNQAGKEVMLNSVALALPSYAMSCVKLLAKLCNELDAMMAKFWWGSKGNERKIHWLSWAKLTEKKHNGGVLRLRPKEDLVPYFTALEYLKVGKDCFKFADKSFVGTIMAELSTMKYDGSRGVQEHILNMYDEAAMLATLGIQVDESFLIQAILNSLPAQFGPFKIHCNAHKKEWSLNELTNLCVHEEVRLRKEKRHTALAVTQVALKKKGKVRKYSPTKVDEPEKSSQAHNGFTVKGHFCGSASPYILVSPTGAAGRVGIGLSSEEMATEHVRIEWLARKRNIRSNISGASGLRPDAAAEGVHDFLDDKFADRLHGLVEYLIEPQISPAVFKCMHPVTNYQLLMWTLSWDMNNKYANETPSWSGTKYLATGASPYTLVSPTEAAGPVGAESSEEEMAAEHVRIEWLARKRSIRSSISGASGLRPDAAAEGGNRDAISEAESWAPGPSLAMMSSTSNSITAFNTKGSTEERITSIA